MAGRLYPRGLALIIYLLVFLLAVQTPIFLKDCNLQTLKRLSIPSKVYVAGSCYTGRTHGRGKTYLASKILYSAKGTSYFQLRRIALSGDVEINPGPVGKRAPGHPYKECDENERKDSGNSSRQKHHAKAVCCGCDKKLHMVHSVITCNVCHQVFHLKCASISTNMNNLHRTYICNSCTSRAFNFSDSFFEEQPASTGIEVLDESSRSDLPVIAISRDKDSRELLIMHLNVNSIQNKTEEVETLMRDFKAQVVFLTETKIDSSYSNNQFIINGYNIYRNDRTKWGGGVMAYFSSALPSKKLSPPRAFKTIEPLIIESKFGKHEVVVLGLYRPPKPVGEAYYLRLEEELNDIFTWVSLQKQFVIITGDLNLDRLRPDKKEGKLLRDLEDIHGLKCLVTEPTRVTDTSQTLLDVILTNKPDLFKECGVFNPEISDHAMVYGVLTGKAVCHQTKIVSFRDFKHLDEQLFRDNISTAPWHVGDIFDSVDDQHDYWIGLMNTIMEEHLPIKKLRVRAKDVPYMTAEWKQAIRSKRKFSKKFSKNRTQENLDLKKKWRNEATKQRRRAIKEYWEKRSNDLKSKPREFYRTFQPFLSSKGKVGSHDVNININAHGKIEKDQGKVADILADYFATMADHIGGPASNKLTEKDFSNHRSVLAISKNWTGERNFNFRKLNITEVKVALEKLNPSKATGCDLLPPRVLKLAASELAPSLTKLYNSCLTQGSWPLGWKKGEWSPVYKKNDRLDRKNYRPITLLNSTNKIFEQLLCRQITDNLDKDLSIYLTAYRKRHSCETTILRLVEDWKATADRKETVGILSTDMSKAFDSLHPALMINKLQGYGFTADALRLIRSYFKDRQCRVKLGSTRSAWKDIQKGCPQGSSFGPLLWNIFQNDMFFEINTSSLSMYADDHQLYVSGQTPQCVETSLNADVELASTWYEDNLLSANLDKYQAMTITGRRSNNVTVAVKAKDVQVEQSDCLKLLGVYIDNKLNFCRHLEEVTKKSSKQVGVIMRLRNLIPVEAKLQIFKSAVLPHLTYCSTVWHFCKASDSRKLERIQERGLRAVFNDKNSPYEKLLTMAQLPSLFNRRLQDIAILMYKVKNKICPISIQDLFTTPDKGHFLRNADFLIPRFNSTTYGKHSIKYFGPFLWSKLNIEDRDRISLDSFRRNIRKKDLARIMSKDFCRGCTLCSG